MVERVIRATVSGWRPWAIGAALSIGWAVLVWRRQRSETRACDEWWQHRERLRANGNRSHPELFV